MTIFPADAPEQGRWQGLSVKRHQAQEKNGQEQVPVGFHIVGLGSGNITETRQIYLPLTRINSQDLTTEARVR